MKTRVYQICEFESFFSEGSGREMPGYHPLPPAVFSQLEHFLLERSSSGSEEAFWMTLSIRRGFGKVITVQNYVGVILMEDGALIEILPKIHSALDCDPDGARTKKLLIEMLKTLREAPFKNFQISSVGSAQMNLFEIFVRMFLDEVFPLVKRGLPCGYEVAEENSAFFRGKLMVSSTFDSISPIRSEVTSSMTSSPPIARKPYSQGHPFVFISLFPLSEKSHRYQSSSSVLFERVPLH